MNSITGSLSELSVIGDGGASNDLITVMDELPLSANAVVSDDNLLIEILLRLPVISLLLFKSVSKRWLYLIKSPSFITHRSQFSNIDPPSGLFMHRLERYEFLRLDSGIPPANRCRLHTTFAEAGSAFKIIQSCNGLLLCSISGWGRGGTDKYYVYNPSINMIRMLPQHDISNLESPNFGSKRIAFDPTKSPHYKVLHVGRIGDGVIQIQTYSSETCSWCVFGDRFPTQSLSGFHDGLYWNDAIHWQNKMEPFHFKLDIVNHPVLTTIQNPPELGWQRYYNSKLFVSGGCLLLVRKDTHSLYRIYEMGNGYSQWTVKYSLNVNDIMMLFPKTLTMYCRNSDLDCSIVWSVVLGEREGDSFMVINTFGKVLQYKCMSASVRTLRDFGSIRLCDRSVGFYPSNIYQFIASFAGV